MDGIRICFGSVVEGDGEFRYWGGFGGGGGVILVYFRSAPQ